MWNLWSCRHVANASDSDSISTAYGKDEEDEFEDQATDEGTLDSRRANAAVAFHSFTAASEICPAAFAGCLDASRAESNQR